MTSPRRMLPGTSIVIDLERLDLGEYAGVASLVRRSGRNPRPRRMDLQIAATAAARELPLLTRNGVDFDGLQQMVEVVAM